MRESKSYGEFSVEREKRNNNLFLGGGGGGGGD